MEIGITHKQRQVLELLASRRWPNGAPLNDLAREMKACGESAVRFHLNALAGRGYVERRQVAPSFKPAFITEAGRRALGLAPEPEVLAISNARLEQPMAVNPARCGPLSATVEEPSHLVECVGDVFASYRQGDFLLIAVGDSMISREHPEDSIFEGDRLLVRPDIWPGPGEIAYVEFDQQNGLHECTLKEWHFDEESGVVRLQPFNLAYPRIELDARQVLVRGVVLEIVRAVRRARHNERPLGTVAHVVQVAVKTARPAVDASLNSNGCSPQPRTKNAARAGLGNQSTGSAKTTSTHGGEPT